MNYNRNDGRTNYIDLYYARRCFMLYFFVFLPEIGVLDERVDLVQNRGPDSTADTVH